jgi:hypothetical protein
MAEARLLVGRAGAGRKMPGRNMDLARAASQAAPGFFRKSSRLIVALSPKDPARLGRWQTSNRSQSLLGELQESMKHPGWHWAPV